MLVVAAVLLVVGGVSATRHVFDRGYDCGTAFAQRTTANGQTEATLMGGTSNTIDCGARIRDQRSLAGGFAVAAALVCTAALLGSTNLGQPRPRTERETFRLNG
jgi:hypothetical protein